MPGPGKDEEELDKIMKTRYGVEHFYIELDVFNDGRCIMALQFVGIADRRMLIRVPGRRAYMDIKAHPAKKD